MLDLDGAALEMGGKEFTYDIPAPFGPKRGPAKLKIVAKPAASVNTEYRAGLDAVMHEAKVHDLKSDRAFKESGDEDAFVKARSDGAKWVQQALASLNFDHCIVSWDTDIQNGGANMEPTRQNFVDLSQFEHPAIVSLFAKIQADLSNHEKFSLDAAEEAQEQEVGNS